MGIFRCLYCKEQITLTLKYGWISRKDHDVCRSSPDRKHSPGVK